VEIKNIFCFFIKKDYIMKKKPQINSMDTLWDAHWLSLKKITYTDAHGKNRTWETVERKKSSGAVVIIGILRPSDRLLLIRQYRPPADAYVIEFPAGLIDAKESPETAALRELKEETGYTGTILHITPPAYNSPGMSGETVNLVVMTIDEDAPENQSVVQNLEENEDIEVCLIKLSKLPDFIQCSLNAGSVIDSKVAAFTVALEDSDYDVEDDE
jgi:ADP-ribose pyrophosphatase